MQGGAAGGATAATAMAKLDALDAAIALAASKRKGTSDGNAEAVRVPDPVHVRLQ
jgi:hypothetical protein